MSSDDRKAVAAAYERYLAAFAADDLAALDAMISYPFAYVGADRVLLLDALPGRPADLRRAGGWDATVDPRYEVVAAAAGKAHVVLYGAERVRADGSLVETVSAFYAFRYTPDRGWLLYAISDVVTPVSRADGLPG